MSLRDQQHRTAAPDAEAPQDALQVPREPLAASGLRTRRPDPKAHILAAAALGVVTEARREGRHLLPTRPAAAAAELLRRHAGEMAVSAIGRDQVLALALLVAADDLAAGRAPATGGDLVLPEPSPDEAARWRVRERVLAGPPVSRGKVRSVAEALERRLRAECASDHELAARLTTEANLHEILWDDPRLPGDDQVRLTMLFSIPALLERAEALDGHRRGESIGRRLDWQRLVPGSPRDRWGLALAPVLAAGLYSPIA